MRVDAAFLAVAAHLTGIGGINVFADDISVVVKGVGGCNHVVGSFALGGVHLGRGDKRSCRSDRVGVSGSGANRFIGAVFGYAFQAIAAEGVSHLVDRGVGIQKRYAFGLVRDVGDHCFFAVGVGYAGEEVACVAVGDLRVVGRGGNREKLSCGIVGKAELTTCAVGYRGDTSRGVGDIHVVFRRIGDPDQSAGGIEKADVFALRERELYRVVERFSAVCVLVEVVALGIAVTAHRFVALFEIDLLAVFADVNATVAGILVGGEHDHALHKVQPEAVTELHRRKIGGVELDRVVLRVRIPRKSAVEEVLDGYGHPVAGPCKVLGLKHKVAALQINRSLTESAKRMGMRAERGVDAVA